MADSSSRPKANISFSRKGAGGNEFNQNYRYDFATGDITLLTDGKSRNSGPTWSNKGDRIAYTSTRRNGADTDIYVEAPTDPKSDSLLAEVKGGGWDVTRLVAGRQAASRAGRHFHQRKLHLAVRRADRRRKRKSPRARRKARKRSPIPAALFSKDGKGIFVTTDRESEFQRLAYIDLAERQAHLSDPGCALRRGQLGSEP